MKVDVLNLEGRKVGEASLSDEVFGLRPRVDILHRVVVWQDARRRSGTAQAKTRGEVVGSGAKIGRQKGSGRARHGDRKAGLFRGGAKAFPPRTRNYDYPLPKRIRRLGLRHALSAKASAGELSVFDDLSLDEPRTATLRRKFESLDLMDSLIVAGDSPQRNFSLAARNLPTVDVLPTRGINVRDVLRRRRLVLSRESVSALESRLSEGRG